MKKIIPYMYFQRAQRLPTTELTARSINDMLMLSSSMMAAQPQQVKACLHTYLHTYIKIMCDYYAMMDIDIQISNFFCIIGV